MVLPSQNYKHWSEWWYLSLRGRIVVRDLEEMECSPIQCASDIKQGWPTDTLESSATTRRVQAVGMDQQESHWSQQGQMQSPSLGRESSYKGMSIHFWDLKLKKDLDKGGVREDLYGGWRWRPCPVRRGCGIRADSNWIEGCVSIPCACREGIKKMETGPSQQCK